MSRFFLFALCLGFPLFSSAIGISFFPLVLQQRYLQNQSNEFINQRINTYGVSLTFENYQLGIETSNWSTESGTSLLSFEEKWKEWNSIHLFKMGRAYDWLDIYSGFGIGSYESTLTSQFAGSVSKTNSGSTLFASGILSLQAIFGYLHAITEIKLLMAKDYQPQPTPDISFKLGISF